VQVDAATVAEVIARLNDVHPGFSDRLLDAEGTLHRFVNVFVSDDDVRYLDGLSTNVVDGSTVSIIPAVAGG
jgi:molybdopterin synthase sulfur carrier subunit